MDTIDGFADSHDTSSTSLFAAAASAPTESSIVYPPSAELLNKADVSALQLLSNSLESVFDSPESSYSDAKLVLSDGREVSFHRFVLSARSPFFKNALAADNFAVKLKLKEIAKDYEVGYDSVVTVLAYVYSSRVRPPPKGVSECADEDCCHVACRPAVDFMLEVLYLAFVFQIPELVTLYQRQLLDVVDKIVIEDTLAILKLANICGEACKNLLDRCRDIVVKSDVDIVSLDKSLPEHIVKQIVEIRKEFGLEAPQVEKHVSKILEQAEKRGPIPRDVPPSLEVAADELKKMRLCVEIQEEQAEKRDPIPPSLAVDADELKIRLLDLENRVSFAQRLFPMEAQVAMDIAQMKETCELEDLTGAKRRALDVNIAPFEITEAHKNRLNALSRTVELGKSFFPRCSGVLDRVLESDDFGEEDTPENRVQKRQRYMEIQETIKKAFSEDTRTRERKSRCFTVMAFLVVINLLLEIASAVADQLSSIHKPYLARISLVMSVLSLVLSIIDFTYKIRDHKAHFRCKWPIPWFYYPSRGYNRLFGSFTDIVLLFCVVGGLIVSMINYSFIERRRDGPIKVSIWPLFFAIGMVASKFMEKPTIFKDHSL